jgi:hypothetical protein
MSKVSQEDIINRKTVEEILENEKENEVSKKEKTPRNDSMLSGAQI